MNRIAIIGAGITGISVAHHLPPGGNITFFDKSRRPGGRVSTRTTRKNPEYSFDHGTAFVNPKSDFLQLLKNLQALKQVNVSISKSLKSEDVDKKISKNFWIGNKRIETIPLRLMQNLSTRHQLRQVYKTRVKQLIQDEHQLYWLLDQSSQKYGPFHKVCFAIPYPQCLQISQGLINFTQQGHKQIIDANTYDCDWIVMLAVKPNTPENKKFISFLQKSDIYETISEDIGSAVNQKHRGYEGEDSLWVFTMNKTWSKINRNLKPEETEAVFMKSLQKTLGIENISAQFLVSHRWLYARPRLPKLSTIYKKNVVMTGDWANNSQNIEQCWNMGKQISELISLSETKGQL